MVGYVLSVLFNRGGEQEGAKKDTKMVYEAN